jgi:TetR/AcrR family transcriptional regulator, cholesterol catabolism regulator
MVDGTNDVAQVKRRKRIMDTAVGLAARGGLKALRIRDLVATTGVSSATIYRYFASKEHLLVAALAEQRFALRQPDGAPLDGVTPAERVINLLRPPTDALTNAPQLAAAMLQAMTSGEPGVAPLLATITEPLVTETAGAIRPTGPTPADRELAQTLQRVWFAALVGWVTAGEPAASINHAVETAAHQLLDPAPNPSDDSQ